MSPNPSSKNTSYSTLTKSLRLFRLLCESPSPISLSKLSKSLSVDAGNLHRIIRILLEEGWIARVINGSEYMVGPLLLSSFDPWHPVQGLRRDAYKLLEQLHHETKETTVLILFLGEQRVVVDALHGRLALSSYYDVRLTSPLHGSASGLILLSGISADARAELLGDEPYHSHTPHTATTRERVESRLFDIIDRGYVVSREEAFQGVVTYGAPIRYRGNVLGCMVITASSFDIPQSKDTFYANHVKASADLLGTSSPFVHQLSFLTHG